MSLYELCNVSDTAPMYGKFPHLTKIAINLGCVEYLDFRYLPEILGDWCFGATSVGAKHLLEQ